MSVYNIASYPGVRGEGRRKRTPGAHCLHMHLIKSPFCDDNVFVWVGFVRDVDIRARALRSRLATNSISTVCSRYGQSSTHSCSIDLQFLLEIIDGDGGRLGNSEALVGHIDRTLVSTNEVSTRFCLMLECFSCF